MHMNVEADYRYDRYKLCQHNQKGNFLVPTSTRNLYLTYSYLC